MTNPALAVSVPGRGRLYRDPRDEALVPSVTNVIEVLAKPWLGGWAAKLVAGEAYDKRDVLMQMDDRESAVDFLKGAPYRKRDAAAKVGDKIHAYAESMFTDEPAPALEPVHEPFIEALLGFIEAYQPTFEILEGTVFSVMDYEELRYAGSFDFLCSIAGVRLLGDYKTGASVYDEVALQLAALRNGEVVWDQRTGDLLPMPQVDGCIAVHLRPEGHAVHVIDAGLAARDAFLGLRAAWPWNKEHGAAVGPRMNPLRLAKEFSAGAAGEAAGKRGAPPQPSGAPAEDSPAAETVGEAGEPTAPGVRAAGRAAAVPGDGPGDSSQSTVNDADPASPAGVTTDLEAAGLISEQTAQERRDREAVGG